MNALAHIEPLDRFIGATLTDHDAPGEASTIVSIQRRGVGSVEEWLAFTTAAGWSFGGKVAHMSLRVIDGGLEVSLPAGLDCTISGLPPPVKRMPEDLGVLVDRVVAKAQALAAAPLVVWVVFHETNTGTADDSDGWIESVWATEALAEAEALRLCRAARDDGQYIWKDPDDPEAEGHEDWQHDWTVQAHAVSSAPTPTEAPGAAPVVTSEAGEGI